MSRTLYHYPLSPFSRKVRLFLIEKNIPFEMEEEHYWRRRPEFLAMNPASQVPVLIDHDGLQLSDSTAICEYVEEVTPSPSLIGRTPQERAEIRRVSGWFNNKFYYEVTKNLLDEKLFRFLRNQGEPRSHIMKVGHHNIRYHLDYIGHLTHQRHWLGGGDQCSFADITAAAHLSVLDYFGDVPWEQNDYAKRWYATMKSRPSFRSLLQDKLPNFKPVKHYTLLDF